jgi:hypothetical protein
VTEAKTARSSPRVRGVIFPAREGSRFADRPGVNPGPERQPKFPSPSQDLQTPEVGAEAFNFVMPVAGIERLPTNL